jgi:hypothetical protein
MIDILLAAATIALAILYSAERIVNQMAISRAAFDADLAGVITAINQLVTDVQALITAINAGQDFTAEANTVASDLAAIQAVDASVTGETGSLGAAPPSGAATKPPA